MFAALGALLMLSAFPLGRWWRQRAEPTHAGRTFSSWLTTATREVHANRFRADGTRLSSNTVAVFRAMGTNALLLLLDRTLANEAATSGLALTKRVGEHWSKLTQHLPQFFDDLPGSRPTPDQTAWILLQELQPPLAVLLPLATNRLAGTNRQARFNGLHLLGLTGDDQETAARHLAPLLISPDPYEPWMAVSILQRFGPEAVVALPELIIRLEDRSFWPAVDCVSALGPAASNALPALRRLFDAESAEFTKFNLALAANRISPDDFWAEALTRSALATGNDEFRRSVIAALSWRTNLIPRFGKELMTVTRTGPEYLAVEAIRALVRFPPEPEDRLPHLLEGALHSPHGEVQALAALRLLELRPHHRPAFAHITNALANLRSANVPRELMLAGLARMGPAAAPALPVIRSQEALPSPQVRQAATAALRAIEEGNQASQPAERRFR